MKKEKRIPTILGLILLLGSVIAGVSLTKQKTNFSSNASGDCTPINPQVTNITNHSFNISFVTSAQCLANISVENRSITDSRFVNTGIKENATRTHYFEVNGLTESNNYQYTIISGGNNFSHTNYKALTGKKPSTSIPTSNLAWGRVFNPDLSAAEGSIVYLNIPGASSLSALVTSNGNWNISLATSFNDQKNNWFIQPASVSEDFIVISSDGQATQITGNTSRNNPVPDIIIGQNKFSELPSTGSPEISVPDTGFIDTIPTSKPETRITVDNPSENETIFTTKPDFFGSAPKNSKVKIQIEATTNTNDEVNSANDGTWHWSPSKDLVLGQQTITISLSESPAIKISRKFTIVSENNVGMAFTASQSAVTPTMIPTSKLEPTAKPTAVPTIVPTIVRVSKPSTASGVPKTGMALPTIFLIILSAVFFLISYKKM